MITLLNLVAGTMACILVLRSEPVKATVLIAFALLFDFLDGAMARLLKSQSPLGEQLDSLADIVSFGIAPGFIMWTMILSPAGETSGIMIYLPYLTLLVPVCSALRLARFNTEPLQKYTFRGLPTPASAIFLASLPLITDNPGEYPILSPLLFNPFVLAFITIAISLLMILPLPMLSLKFRNFRWTENWMRYVLLTVSVILIAIFHFAAFPLIIILYILMSIVFIKS
jgi:CDP-diacylglycerol--serine O-phosphatidyltransferase